MISSRNKDSASGQDPDQDLADIIFFNDSEILENLDPLEYEQFQLNEPLLHSFLGDGQHFELEIKLSPEDNIDSLRLIHSETGELLTTQAELHVGTLSAPRGDIPSPLATEEALISRIRHDLVHPLGWRLYVHYFPQSEAIGLLEAGVEVFTTAVHQYLFPDDAYIPESSFITSTTREKVFAELTAVALVKAFVEDFPEAVEELRQTIETDTARLRELLESQQEAKLKVQYRFPALRCEAAFETVERISQFQASLSFEADSPGGSIAELRKLLTPSMQSMRDDMLRTLIQDFVREDPVYLRIHLSLPYFVEDLRKITSRTSDLCAEFIDMVCLSDLPGALENADIEADK